VSEVIVGFWNCTLSKTWFTLTMEQRIVKLRAAVLSVDVEGRIRSQAGAGRQAIQTIFVAPEYAFCRECPDSESKKIGKAALQTDAEGYQQLLSALKMLTRQFPYVLLAPGTIAHTKNESAMNTCIAVLGGNVRSVFHKKEGVGEVRVRKEVDGEVTEGDGLTFKPGTGCGLVAEGGKTFLLHICRDATITPDAQAPTFDVHIVVGQGVGADAIAKRGTQLLIVADFGSYGVTDLRTNKKLLCYRKDTLLDCDIHFYRAQID